MQKHNPCTNWTISNSLGIEPMTSLDLGTLLYQLNYSKRILRITVPTPIQLLTQQWQSVYRRTMSTVTYIWLVKSHSFQNHKLNNCLLSISFIHLHKLFICILTANLQHCSQNTLGKSTENELQLLSIRLSTKQLCKFHKHIHHVIADHNVSWVEFKALVSKGCSRPAQSGMLY